MRVAVILWSIGVWLRRYAVALALIGTLGGSLVAANLWGTAPSPQQPPEGYVSEDDRATLQWDKGTRKAPITLQISLDDPDFGKPLVDKAVSGTGHTLSKLERGGTYYWRLVQDGVPGPTASFGVSKYNASF